MPDSIRFEAAALAELIRDCCRGVGLSDRDSRAVAEVLLYANLRGQDAHGFVRVSNYMRRVERGLATGTESLAVAAEHGALRRVDAGRAIGPAAATWATDLAIEVARAHGVGVVGLGDTTHFGAAGFYARRAAEQGFVAVVLSNGPKAVAPHGAAEALVGTNPIAFGIPTGAAGPMVLDFATSAIPRGRIRQAAERGETIPPGAALDAHGRPTTDAQAALAGAILPFGGARGSGLALAVTLLTALIADAQLDDEMGAMEPGSGSFPLFPGSVGHVFVVIDPRPLTGDRGIERAAAFAERLHELDPAAGFDQPRLPGERGDATAARRAAEGIPIPAAQVAEVAETCRELGLEQLAGRLGA